MEVSLGDIFIVYIHDIGCPLIRVSLEDRFYCIEGVLSSECPLKTGFTVEGVLSWKYPLK